LGTTSHRNFSQSAFPRSSIARDNARDVIAEV
jgi:hypothetical protein